mmetsp:Transcript_99458/g.306687  ORF Transcript_99458/g.306687 Transcript_99458/m.306687 type:complete len:215 (+) Transcript_99458:431-1075(+)
MGGDRPFALQGSPGRRRARAQTPGRGHARDGHVLLHGPRGQDGRVQGRLQGLLRRRQGRHTRLHLLRLRRLRQQGLLPGGLRGCRQLPGAPRRSQDHHGEGSGGRWRRRTEGDGRRPLGGGSEAEAGPRERGGHPLGPRRPQQVVRQEGRRTWAAGHPRERHSALHPPRGQAGGVSRWLPGVLQDGPGRHQGVPVLRLCSFGEPGPVPRGLQGR